MKCNAKSGRFTVDDVNVTKISFIADLENAESGWIKFSEGQSPDFRMARVADLLENTPYPAMPPERGADGKPLYRRGFRIMVKIGDKLAGNRPSIRELAATSFCINEQLDNLLRAWWSLRQPGKLPVVSCEAWLEVKGPHGSNFAPVFKIARLIDRPADLLDGGTDPAVPGHVANVPGEPETIDGEDEPEDFSDDDFGEAA